MASEHSNSFIALHSKLDSIIQVIGNVDDYTIPIEELQEQFVQDIVDSDILVSLKKHFLLGHCLLQKNQIQESIAHFQQSLRFQEELSFETLNVLTLTSLFECYRITNSFIQEFEYACLLENEQNLPKRIRKHILEALHKGYSYVGLSKKAIEILQIYLKTTLTEIEKIHAQLSIIRLQFKLNSNSKIQTLEFENFEESLKTIQYDREISEAYLTELYQNKEYERLSNVASTIKEFHSQLQQPFGVFRYFEAIAAVHSSQKIITENERIGIVEQCIREKQYLYAILVNIAFLTESDLPPNLSFEILESSVKLFDASIPLAVQVDILERLVESCENVKEWKKGLYYFELYHNALQTIANDNNTKTIETIQLKQFISTINKHHIPHAVSTDMLQRRSILLQQQQGEYEQFLVSLKRYVQSGMNNPLEIIKNLPIQRYSSDLAETVISITRSMISTVETVIELHALEDETYNGNFETIPLISIIERLESQFHLLANQYECSIEIFIDKQIQWYGDVGLLSKSLFHIIQNACKFSLKNSTIVLKASLTNNEILISISDSGVGVAEEHFALIFSKYFQYDPLSTNYQSAGLGLPYCKKAISYLRGTIQLHSKVEVGTEVIISLPNLSSTNIPSPSNPAFLIKPSKTILSESDMIQLKKVVSIDINSTHFSKIITELETIVGSKEIQEWKRNAYISLLYGDKEKVHLTFAQIH